MLIFKDLDRAEKIQLIVAYILQLILIGSSILAIYKKNWLTLFLIISTLILTFLPAIFRRNFKVFIPIEFDFVIIVFVFTSIFLGEVQGYYTHLWWWDVVMHTSSGILLGIAAFVLIYILNEEEKIHIDMKPGFIALFAFAFAVASGAVWEIFEYTLDSTIGTNMQASGLVDTMWDLIVDCLGAILISVLGYFYIRRNDSLLFERFVHRFVRKNPQLFKKKE